MNRLMRTYGKEAVRKGKQEKEAKERLEKVRAKKLLALQAEQEQIIRGNPKKKLQLSRCQLEEGYKVAE